MLAGRTEQEIELIEPGYASGISPLAFFCREEPHAMNVSVRATCHTDDYRYEISAFDATPWFIIASDSEIQQLIEDGFGGSYTAGGIAEDAKDYDAQVRAMFAYLDCLPASYDPRGFECYVDEAQALAWI